MKRRYRITPEGPPKPTDAEIARYRDTGRLMYHYTKAVRRPRKPLYRDPKAFVLLLFIVLIAYLISEERQKQAAPTVTPTQQGTPDR
ncbi:MAG: hypothetical protein IT225_02700 [Flavobacteriales bacterium]|nr:hypothetical protein [Flavobacteriales bacterium]